ncbi:ABC transporter permease [Thalassiella azotivora]
MIDALRFEWVRLRTVRSTYWLVGLAIGLPAVVTGLVGWFSREEDLASGIEVAVMTGGVALFPLPIPAVLVGILGVLSMGHEYRHGTIRPTLSALPRRSVLVAAKLAVVVVAAVLVAIAGLVANYAVFAVTRGAPEIDGRGRAAMVGYVVLLVLWAVVGLGATLLARVTALVLPLLFVLPLVIEPVLFGLTFIPALDGLQPVTRFLPFSAGSQLAQSLPLEQVAGASGPGPLSRVENGAVFAAFALLVLAPAWALFERRDA